jgi:hypothetical protein
VRVTASRRSMTVLAVCGGTSGIAAWTITAAAARVPLGVSGSGTLGVTAGLLPVEGTAGGSVPASGAPTGRPSGDPVTTAHRRPAFSQVSTAFRSLLLTSGGSLVRTQPRPPHLTCRVGPSQVRLRSVAHAHGLSSGLIAAGRAPQRIHLSARSSGDGLA